MFGFTMIAIALLDELLLWLRCRQLQREAREAAERFIEVFERHEENVSLPLYSVILYITFFII